MHEKRESRVGLRIYYFCSFHLARLFNHCPVAFTALLLSASFAALGLGSYLYWSRDHMDLEAAVRKAKQSHALRTSATTEPVQYQPPRLPDFASAEFTAQFQQLVKEIGLRTEEVSYSLETGAGQPYWRYRISLQVQSGYPLIRKLLAAIASEFPNATLDGIQCTRENTAAVGLKCELSLSAFFRKPQHA